MRTTNGHLAHMLIALGALILAMTAMVRIVQPAPVQDVLPVGVVVDDGVPF